MSIFRRAALSVLALLAVIANASISGATESNGPGGSPRSESKFAFKFIADNSNMWTAYNSMGISPSGTTTTGFVPSQNHRFVVHGQSKDYEAYYLKKVALIDLRTGTRTKVPLTYTPVRAVSNDGTQILRFDNGSGAHESLSLINLSTGDEQVMPLPSDIPAEGEDFGIKRFDASGDFSRVTFTYGDRPGVSETSMAGIYVWDVTTNTLVTGPKAQRIRFDASETDRVALSRVCAGQGGRIDRWCTEVWDTSTNTIQPVSEVARVDDRLSVFVEPQISSNGRFLVQQTEHSRYDYSDRRDGTSDRGRRRDECNLRVYDLNEGTNRVVVRKDGKWESCNVATVTPKGDVFYATRFFFGRWREGVRWKIGPGKSDSDGLLNLLRIEIAPDGRTALIVTEARYSKKDRDDPDDKFDGAIYEADLYRVRFRA